MVAACLKIITKEQLDALREAGFVIVHREPSDNMRKSFYAKEWPECVDFTQGYHRMVAQSIREQNNDRET